MILIIGATGTIGRILVKQLTAQGATFRAFVRDFAKGEALGCDYVVGDLDDAKSVAAAVTGVERVFLNSAPGPDLTRQQTAVIDAAKAAGVSHIVKLSAPGADRQSQVLQARQHGEIEAYLAESGLAWSLLRPSFFMQNFFGHANSIRHMGQFFGAYRDGRIGFIDVEDIAAVATMLLTGDAHEGEAFHLTGSESLTHAEVALCFSQKLGREIQYVDLPVAQMVAQMLASGMHEDFARGLGVMMTGMAAGYAAATTDVFFKLTGQQPRTFNQFIEDNLVVFR